MNRITLLLAIVAVSAAACGKKADQSSAGSGTATATGSAAPAVTPDAAAPAPTVDAAAAAPPAGAPTAGAISGPHASIDAYCATVSATFVKDVCFSQSDQVEMCSCAAADQDDLTGNTKAGGKSPNLLGATLVTVADNAADYTHCSLALQLAGGWHVVHKAFPCAPAPVSHDGGIAVTTNQFNISADNKLTYQWTAEDGEGRKAHAIACVAPTADKVECAPPVAK